MPSVSMCTNDYCPKASDCFRHEAIPSAYQAYADFKYTEEGCDDFLEIYDKQRLNEQKDRVNSPQIKVLTIL